jgi:hypothetical protein
MGLEATCVATSGRQKGAGRARLEEKELLFRGTADFRLKIPLREAKAEARRGRLIVQWPGGKAQFALGAAAAEKWASKIRTPRSRMDKLGVKPGMRVSVLGVAERAFWQELEARVANASDGRLLPDADLIFFQVDDASQLKRLRELQRVLRPAGAIWVVWPKGRPQMKEDHIRAVAPGAKLVDVKVCAFSETFSALKLMIPRAAR